MTRHYHNKYLYYAYRILFLPGKLHITITQIALSHGQSYLTVINISIYCNMNNIICRWVEKGMFIFLQVSFVGSIFMTKLQNLAKISNILKKNINTKTNYFMVLSMLMLTQTFFFNSLD